MEITVERLLQTIGRMTVELELLREAIARLEAERKPPEVAQEAQAAVRAG